jgi:hypothetical protein
MLCLAFIWGEVPVALNPVRAALDKSVKPSSRDMPVSDLARLYDLHAEDCVRTAEKVDNPSYRAMLLKAAAEWRQAARQLQHTAPSQEQPPSQKLHAQNPASRTKRAGRGG